MQDPHAILGLPRHATPDQIRAAYRRLARELHPDVSKRPDAARRFAAVAEAYQRLTDQPAPIPTQPATRARPAPDESDSIDAAEAGETFDAFFRAARPRGPRRPPPFVPVPGTLDLELELPVSATEAAEGVRLTVPTPTGPHELHITPGTPADRVIRMESLGALGRAGRRGDLLVRIRIVPASGAGVADGIGRE